MEKIRILIVEDEANVREPLCKELAAAGFLVDSADSLSRAQESLQKNHDLIVLDWNLPDGEGIDWVRDLRSNGWTLPILFLTGRSDVIDKVVGLELGANDYLVKPVDTRELIARIRAHQRAAHSKTQNSPNDPATIIELGDLKLNPQRREVTWKGQSIDLKKKEYELLELIGSEPNKVFTRDELLNKVWGFNTSVTTRTIDNHILQLRQKFPELTIETIRGLGYRLKCTD